MIKQLCPNKRTVGLYVYTLYNYEFAFNLEAV